MTEQKRQSKNNRKQARAAAEKNGHVLLKRLTLGGVVHFKGDTITLRPDQVERLRQRGVIK